MNEENEQVDAQQVNLTDDSTSTNEVDTTTENAGLSPEEITELKKKAEVSSQNYERAKKAEKELQELRAQSENKKETKFELSPRDAMLLAKANVEIDDVDEVLEFAKFKKLEIKDALANKTLIQILSDKKEERKTANASQTRATARADMGVKPEAILQRAETTGQIPEDDEGMAKLVKARRDRKLGVFK